jgi:hypothetical protein
VRSTYLEERTQMHCIYCGIELPDVAIYCTRCGRAVQQSSVGDGVSPQGSSPADEDGGTVQTGKTTGRERPLGSYRGAVVYGWLFVVAAVYLLVTAAITLFASLQATPLPALGASQPIGAASAIVQGALFLATGLAILKRRLVAVRLVWVSTALAGLGVLMRGIIPIDLVSWVVTLVLAMWFSKKRAFLVQ